jgi:hypothetical protein
MYIMFAAFSRVVQSIFVFCIQLSRVIVSATFVVTSPFTYILFIWVVMAIVFLRRSYYKSYSVFSTCASVQCSHWLISLYLVLIQIGFSGDTMHPLLLNSVFFWICELKCETAYLLKYLSTILCSVLYHTWNCYIFMVFFCFSFYSFNIPPLMLNLLRWTKKLI